MAKAQLSNSFFPSFANLPFGLITKPIGSKCNLNCTYCYYLEKENLYHHSGSFRMNDALLENYIRQYIDAQPDNAVSFVWQGGEPGLLGIDFYKKVLAYQKKYAAGKIIENAFQTNGTLINEDWCLFLRDNNFLVGISIDGPEKLHNKYRQTRTGSPTFESVMKAIYLFNKHRVEYNTLTTLNNHNAEFPVEIYTFLKSIGSRFIQFLPVVERIEENEGKPGGLLPVDYQGKAQVTPWSVDSVQFGKFMITVFDEWVKQDVGAVFVQLFDATLANWIGESPGVCMYAPICGRSAVIEHNGDVYSCDHMVFPEYFLGNINQDSLAELMNGMQQQVFGQDKYSKLPGKCLKCKFLNACYGECPKKRFNYTDENEYGLNYLCEGYYNFYGHVAPYMNFMVSELKNKRSPGNIMYNLDKL